MISVLAVFPREVHVMCDKAGLDLCKLQIVFFCHLGLNLSRKLVLLKGCGACCSQQRCDWTLGCFALSGNSGLLLKEV